MSLEATNILFDPELTAVITNEANEAASSSGEVVIRIDDETNSSPLEATENNTILNAETNEHESIQNRPTTSQQNQEESDKSVNESTTKKKTMTKPNKKSSK